MYKDKIEQAGDAPTLMALSHAKNLKVDRRELIIALSGGVFTLSLGGLLTGCGGGGGGGGSSSSTSPTQGTAGSVQPKDVYLFPNPADSNLALVVTTSGQTISYQGSKDATGTPLALTSAYVDSPDLNASKRVHLTFDGQGRPATAVQADGGAVTFSYISTSEVDLAVAPSSGSSGTVKYDPTTKSASHVKASSQPHASRKSASPHTANAVTGTVTVTCEDGMPLDGADVNAFFKPNNTPPELANLQFPVDMVPLGPTPGVFQYIAPTSPFTNPPTVADFLSRVKDVLDGPCTFLTGSGSGIGLDDTAVTNLSLAAAVIGPEASALVAVVGNAAIYACKANDKLGIPGIVQQFLDILEGGGTLLVTATYPRQQPIQATKLISAQPTQVPSFTLSFPNSVCIDHINISPTSLSLNAGQTGTLTATPVDKNGNTVTGNFTYIWLSSNESIASVDPSSGVVTGVAAGTANITVSETDAGKTSQQPAVVTVTTGTYDGTLNLAINVTPAPQNGSAAWSGNGTCTSSGMNFNVNADGSLSGSGTYSYQGNYPYVPGGTNLQPFTRTETGSGTFDVSATYDQNTQSYKATITGLNYHWENRPDNQGNYTYYLQDNTYANGRDDRIPLSGTLTSSGGTLSGTLDNHADGSFFGGSDVSFTLTISLTPPK